MAHSKSYLLDLAIKITEAYARGGGSQDPDLVLRKVYEELKRLDQEAGN